MQKCALLKSCLIANIDITAKYRLEKEVLCLKVVPYSGAPLYFCCLLISEPADADANSADNDDVELNCSCGVRRHLQQARKCTNTFTADFIHKDEEDFYFDI